LNGDFSDLLRRAQGGDSAAFAEIHARYERLVHGVVRRRLGPALRRKFDSVDVVQSVFEDVLRDLPRFEDRGEEKFRHWLFMKAENKVRDAHRRALDADGAPRETRLATNDDLAPEGVAGPATQAGQADDEARLAAILSTMSAEQREVLNLHDREGLRFAEIAERLSLPSEDAARMRYGRALIELRRRWKGP
jgi:RNA polymerase sigma-70 factor (ECF subfamily)